MFLLVHFYLYHRDDAQCLLIESYLKELLLEKLLCYGPIFKYIKNLTVIHVHLSTPMRFI